MTDSNAVAFEVDAEGVALVTLNRSDKLNAFNAEQTDALRETIVRIDGDDGVRTVVITGAGRAFSAGADIAEFGALQTSQDFRRFIAALEGAFEAIERLRQPVIAAINGVAFGGGFELALACDLRIIDEGARVGLPEIKLGLLPGAGGTQRILRHLPRGAAFRLLATGEPLPAVEAHRLGLVEEIAPAGTAVDVARALARQLADGPSDALAAAKQLVQQGTEVRLADGLMLEREAVAGLFDRADRAEGVAAFLERRPPDFRRRSPS